MNIDLSTITPIGLVALLLICVAVTGVTLYLVRAMKSLKIKTNKATFELGKNLAMAQEGGINMSRDIVKKQSNLAKHHMLTIAGDLRHQIKSKFDMTQEEKNTVWLLVALFTAELKYQVLNNFTENHIGNTDQEIEEYTKVRSREYTAFLESFFDDHDWVIPRFRVKEVIDDLPETYLYKKLFTVYKDGKDLEKHIKKGEL